MTSEIDSLLEFPCRFPVKAMGRNRNEFESLVTAREYAEMDGLAYSVIQARAVDDELAERIVGKVCG